MEHRHASNIEIVIPKAALIEIFDECDRYDHDETGGRIVGHYHKQDDKLIINVEGIIGPGPRARRSPTVLWQDGEYQESAFRTIEQQDSSIEHLGTWHTHHVNGLQTLSGGDVATYTKTVNHHNHNTDFFYALLVVSKRRSKDPLERYAYKHFVFRRGDDGFYEVGPRHVKITEAPLVWPVASAAENSLVSQIARKATAAYHHATGKTHQPENERSQTERVYDRDILAQFYPGVKPFSSPKLGFYWRGNIELLDGTRTEVVLVEDASGHKPTYSIMLRNAATTLKPLAESLAKKEFPSARLALISAERLCNRIIFEEKKRETQSD